MLDAQLLAASIASRDAYARIAPHITAKDLTPAVGFWYELVGAWYARDSGSTHVDIESIRSLGESRITNPKQRETLLGALVSSGTSASPDNTAQIALELKRRNTGLELAAAIAKGDEKRTATLYKEFGDLLAATSLGPKKGAWQFAVSIEDLFKKVGNENRIPLAPSKLNERIGGGALPGHHIVVYARPEMGKSTFAVNMACVLATKRDKKVLYVGNEDQIDILKTRATSRVTGMTWVEAQANEAKAIRLYRQSGAEDRLRFAQLSDGSPNIIRQQIEEFEPSVLILDQIRNLASSEDGMVSKLEANGIAVRKLLLEYGLIGLSVTQAAGSAEGKVWLDMTDVDSSKTGLPGTADLLVGIGASQEMNDRNQRAISLPKNKLDSAPNSHEGFIVEVDKSRSKYR